MDPWSPIDQRPGLRTSFAPAVVQQAGTGGSAARKFCMLLQAALRRRPVQLRTEKTKDQWRNNQSVMAFSSRDSGLRRS